MTKRFSRLKYALRSIQSPTAASNNTPPAGSVLENFSQFQNGGAVVNYPRDAASQTGGLNLVYVSAFHTPFDAGEATPVDISKRVADFATIAPVRTAAGVDTTAPTTLIELKRFIPAKAIVRLGTATAGVNTVSQITGIPYSKKDDPSYTIPMGQKTGATFESDVRADVLTAVAALGANASVSFDSEEVG